MDYLVRVKKKRKKKKKRKETSHKASKYTLHGKREKKKERKKEGRVVKLKSDD